jgi:copper oxidase (laccase) domain-containing protein
MPGRGLETMAREAGVGPEQVHVYVGPSIRVCCYRVGDDVAQRFPTSALQQRNGAWHLDLVAAARIQLARAGVPPEHIVDLLECTACNPSRYFSHRRDAGRTGRLWAVAAWRGSEGGIASVRSDGV